MVGERGSAVYPWTVAFAESLAAVTLAGSVRGHFNIPQLFYGATFRIWLPSRTAGTITASLRFGHRAADADISTLGINFTAALALTDASDFRSVVFADGAAAPGTDGSPQAFLPPHVSVILTTAAGTTLQYAILYAGQALL